MDESNRRAHNLGTDTLVSSSGVLLRDQWVNLDWRNRRGGGGAGGWQLQVLPLPRPLRQDGGPQGEGEDCEYSTAHIDDSFKRSGSIGYLNGSTQ